MGREYFEGDFLMIVEVKEEGIVDVVEFSWTFMVDQQTCSFPKYQDVEQFKKVFLRSLESEDDKVLACVEDGVLVGILNLQVIKKDLYLQALAGIFAKGDFDIVASQFVDYIRLNYSNFQLYFGYPLENKTAIAFLEKVEAELLDACFTMKLIKEEFNYCVTQHKVVELPTECYEEYAVFHDQHNPGIYWNSERLFQHLDKWNIYVVIEEQKIIGSIMIRNNGVDAEIYGISVEDVYTHQQIELDLLSSSIEGCFSQGNEEILFFVNEDDDAQIEATLKSGFKQVDTYRCYRIQL